MTPLGAARQIRKLIVDLGRKDWHVSAAKPYLKAYNDHFVIEIEEGETASEQGHKGWGNLRMGLAVVHVEETSPGAVGIRVAIDSIQKDSPRARDAVRTLEEILNLVRSS